MKRPVISTLCASTALLLGLAVGCGGDDDSPAASEENPHCQALAEVCDPVSASDEALEQCHEVGHDGDAEACEAEFDGCIDMCLDAMPEGSGGQGGGSGADFDLCGFLASFCHDGTSDAAVDCHELGHDGDAEACLDEADDCIHTCAEAEHS